MRDIFILGVFAGIIPAILFKPHVGILVWAWISYMSPHRFTWGFAYDFRFALICAAVTVLAWIISREPVRVPWRSTSILIGLLILWTAVTTQFAVSPNAAAVGWEKSTKILFMTLVTLGLMQSRERIHAFIWVIVVSVGSFGVKGAAWFLTGGNVSGGRVWGPPGSFLEGNNELALALAMVIPLLLYLRTQSHYAWLRLGLAAASLLCFISIIGSFSRGAFVAVVVVGGALILRSRHRFQLGILVLLSIFAVGLYAPEQWVARIDSIANYEEDSSAVGRLHLWEFAWNLALDRPIVGGGIDAFSNPTTFAKYAPSGAIPRAYHSIYFQMLGDHGFVGLGIFLLLFLSAFVSIKRVKRSTRDRPDMLWANELARMTEVSLLAFAVGGLFYSLAIFDLFYHLLIMALLLRIVVEREINVDLVETALPLRENTASGNGRRWAPKFNA